MAGKFEINQKVYPKDHGQIVLYQRADHKNPKWQTRIKVKGSRGYIIKSTGTTDEYDARKFADDVYDSLVVKFKSTGSTRTKTFKQVADEWLKTLEQQGRNSKNIKEFRMRLYNYPVKFWGDTYIDAIKDNDLVAYIDWRKSNGRHRKIPSPTTIKKDNVPLNLLFKYAFGQKYISQRLQFDSFQAKSKRRPEFLKHEWNEMTDKLNDWLEKGKKHPRTYRSRLYLKYFILIIGNTGIRSGSETHSLHWNSFEYYYDLGGGKTGLMIHVNRGKVDERPVVAGLVVQNYLEELKKYRVSELKKKDKSLDKNESIFCSSTGETITSFKKGLKEFLTAYGMLKHPNGKIRVPYSLRHTYATRHIRKVPHWDLAKNMGTSVEQLERYYVHDNPDQYGDVFIDDYKGNTIDLTFNNIEPNLSDLLIDNGGDTISLDQFE